MRFKKYNEISEEIKKLECLIKSKSKNHPDFEINVKTTNLIYLEDTEAFEAHYVKEFVQISLGGREFSLEINTVKLFLKALESLAKDYDEDVWISPSRYFKGCFKRWC